MKFLSQAERSLSSSKLRKKGKHDPYVGGSLVQDIKLAEVVN